jgi:hypothetical protein
VRAMQTRRSHLSATRYWPNYRQMAADGLHLARKATSEFERERYILATAFFVKRVLEIEQPMQPGAPIDIFIEAILTEPRSHIEARPTRLSRAS